MIEEVGGETGESRDRSQGRDSGKWEWLAVSRAAKWSDKIKTVIWHLGRLL